MKLKKYNKIIVFENKIHINNSIVSINIFEVLNSSQHQQQIKNKIRTLFTYKKSKKNHLFIDNTLTFFNSTQKKEALTLLTSMFEASSIHPYKPQFTTLKKQKTLLLPPLLLFIGFSLLLPIESRLNQHIQTNKTRLNHLTHQQQHYTTPLTKTTNSTLTHFSDYLTQWLALSISIQTLTLTPNESRCIAFLTQNQLHAFNHPKQPHHIRISKIIAQQQSSTSQPIYKVILQSTKRSHL